MDKILSMHKAFVAYQSMIIILSKSSSAIISLECWTNLFQETEFFLEIKTDRGKMVIQALLLAVIFSKIKNFKEKTDNICGQRWNLNFKGKLIIVENSRILSLTISQYKMFWDELFY